MALEKAGLECDFRISEWLVSPALNQISRNGSSARVEPKAMRVLVYLAEHPGVVSKDQIISAVWPDVFVSDDVLPGCISALRKAFSDDARRPRIIETIHKGGYRLLPPIEWLNGNGQHYPAPAMVPKSQPRRLLSSRAVLASSATLAAVLLAVVFAWAPLAHRYDSIAVLPFVDAGDDPSIEYLSDGIAEQVTNDLSQLSTLRVMAWTTVARYRGPKVDVRAAGRDLGVKAVLTGHLSRVADHIALEAELVDVTRGAQLWGKHYERQASQISQLQQQLSSDIASSLRVKLNGDQQAKLESHHSESPAAYQLYLQGRFFWEKRTKQGLDRGIDFFQRAIAEDPNYARAYAGLADCYNLLDDWGETAPRDSFPKARAAAEKALALDESLAEAHASLAMVHVAYDWDWAGAEQEFKRAIQLNPNYATAHQWYGLFLASMGRFPEAEVEVKRAMQLDPLSPIVNMALAEVYTWERRYDDAIAEYKRIIALDPSFLGSYGNLSYVYEQKRMYSEAVSTAAQHWVLAGEPDFAHALQRTYAKSGYTAVLREELKKEFQENARGKYTNTIGVASMYAALGDEEHALAWIEKGYEEHSSSMQFLAVEPEFDPIRSSPRYQYWLGVLNFPTAMKFEVSAPRS